MADQITIKVTENKEVLVENVLDSLKTTDAAPTTVGLYRLSEVGTYTNLGGLITTAGKINDAYFDGTNWRLIANTIPNYQNPIDNLTSTSTTESLAANQGNVLFKMVDLAKTENWTAKSFSQGKRVIYDNEIFEATANVTSTDIPYLSNLWEKKVGVKPQLDIIKNTKLTTYTNQGATIENVSVNYWGITENVNKITLTSTSQRLEYDFSAAVKIPNLTFYIIAEIYSETTQSIKLQLYNRTTSSYLTDATKTLKAGLNRILISYNANITSTNSLVLMIGKAVGVFYLKSVRYFSSDSLPYLTNEKTINEIATTSDANNTQIGLINESFQWIKIATPALNYTTDTTVEFSSISVAKYKIPVNMTIKVYFKAQYTGRFVIYGQNAAYSSIVLLDVNGVDFSAGVEYYVILPTNYSILIAFRTFQTGVLINELSISKKVFFEDLIPIDNMVGVKWTSFGDSVTALEDWQKRVANLTGISTYVRACGSSAITFSIGQMAVRPDGYYIDRRNIYTSDEAFIAGVNSKGFTNQITSVSWTDYSANPAAYPTIGSDATAYFLIDTQANSTDRVNTIPLDSDIVSIMFYNDFQTWTDATIGTLYDYTIDTGVNSGRGTYIANLRQMIAKIKARVPKAKIIVMIPYQNTSGKYNLTTNTLTAEGIGVEKMRDALRNVARTYGFTIIDLTKIINYYTAVYYIGDTIHANYNGCYQIGNFVADEFRKMKEFLIKKIN